jgi:hypothetical protein
MSGASIPKSNGNLKPYGSGYAHYQAYVANLVPPEILQQLASVPVPTRKPTPQGRPPRQRRGPRKSGLYLILNTARQHGITNPTVGGFLRLPREFDAILALEPKPVTQVVLEVLRQTIGTRVKLPDGRAIATESGLRLASGILPVPE